MPGKPIAAFVCPGHPLLDATIDLVIERHRDLLKRGAVLVDEQDAGDQPRVLVYLEHSIQDARTDRSGNRRVVSKRFQFVEISADGTATTGGPAPYLDYRPLTEEERSTPTRSVSEEEQERAAEQERAKRSDEREEAAAPDFLTPRSSPLTPLSSFLAHASGWYRDTLEQKALEHAALHLVPQHLDEVRHRKQELIDKTEAAVKDRLTKEINYWDHRAEQLKQQELAGKINARLNSGLARQRADELGARLKKRLEELAQERKLSPLPPVVVGGALIVPFGLLTRLCTPTRSVSEDLTLARSVSEADSALLADASGWCRDTRRSEQLAMAAVMAAERGLGYLPRDVSDQKLGYDIESAVPNEGRLRFIEVKGRVNGATTVTITKNEILTGFNKPDDFILALGLIDGDRVDLRYVRRPFQREPDFNVTSVNYNLAALLEKAREPS